MDEKELLNAMQTKLDDFKKNLPAYATPEDIQSAVKGMNEEMGKVAETNKGLQKTLDEVKAAAEAQGIVLAKIRTSQEQAEPKTVRAILEPLMKELAEMGDNQGAKSPKIKLDFKTANITLQANIASDPMGMILPGVGQLNARRPNLRPLFRNVNVGPNSHGVVYYTDQLAVTRSAAAKAEGTAAPVTSDITWSGYSLKLEEIKDSIKVSRKALKNIDFMSEEIQRFIALNMALKVDNDLIASAGTTPNIESFLTRATAYAAGSYANTVTAPTIFDLILVIDSIMSTDTRFLATHVFVNQIDHIGMLQQKDTTERVNLPPYVFVNPVTGDISIKGIRVIPTSLVTADTCYLADMNFPTVFSNGTTLEFGYNSDDFTKGLVTLYGVEELALLIKTIEQLSVEYCSGIVTAKGGLTKGI